MPQYRYIIFGTGFKQKIVYNIDEAGWFANVMKKKHKKDVTLIAEHTLTMEREELDYAI